MDTLLENLRAFIAGDLDLDLGDFVPDGSPTMSDTEAYIIQALVVGGEMYGLELMKQSEGRLKRGTIYVTLHRMQEKGFVDSKPDPDHTGPGLQRRLYTASGLGQRVERAKGVGIAAMSLAHGGAA